MLDRLPPRKIRQSAARRASQARLPPLPQAAQVLAGGSLTAKSLWVQLRALPTSKAQDNLRKARSQLRHPAPERRNIRRTNHDLGIAIRVEARNWRKQMRTNPYTRLLF